MHWAVPKLPRGHAQKVRKAPRVSKLHQLRVLKLISVRQRDSTSTLPCYVLCYRAKEYFPLPDEMSFHIS